MKDEKEGEMKTSELKFWRYLHFLGKNVSISFISGNNRRGIISLHDLPCMYQRAVCCSLECQFPEYVFIPEFIANNGRIRFYER